MDGEPCAGSSGVTGCVNMQAKESLDDHSTANFYQHIYCENMLVNNGLSFFGQSYGRNDRTYAQLNLHNGLTFFFRYNHYISGLPKSFYSASKMSGPRRLWDPFAVCHMGPLGEDKSCCGICTALLYKGAWYATVFRLQRIWQLCQGSKV